MECPNCRLPVNDADNFCVHCGAKLKKTCNCWVKKKDNYGCGRSSCPGIKLLILK
ncbi:MAG: zinc-ribbon domain-containing protein [Lachnospiraceae bacterium]|nr:zinc-ribbon domain-containing protein [Lachnospiraceae bacterium]